MLVIESLPVEVRLAYTSLQAEVARLTHIIKLQGEEIRLLNLQRWGPKADKLSENQLALLPLEISVTPAEIEREAALPEKEKALPILPRAKAPRPNHPGR